MTTFDPDHLDSLKGAVLRGTDGDLGTIEELYVDNSDGDLTFATVDTGAIAGRSSFVPLPGAKFEDGVVKVPYATRLVQTAPPVDTDGELSPDDEDRLYVHYGIHTRWAEDLPEPVAEPEPEPEPVRAPAPPRAAPRAPRPPRAGGEEITLSEERLRVGTQRVEAGRARVRKYVVNETETVTVPVSHDEVVIERIPITDGEVGRDFDGAEIAEEVHEVVLTAETPFVQKETVAVERVRVGTQRVVENQSITEDVRREELDVDIDGDVDVR